MLQEIKARYTKESTASCSLSCGSNFNYLSIKPGEHILDLGCGRGNETIQAAILTGPTGKAIGLDLTQAMVDMAQGNAQVHGITNVEFINGNIESLPFNDEEFDAVISNCVINHAPSKAVVYREIYRVLKAGGRFVISDTVTKYPLPLEIKNDPEAWAQCFGGSVTEEEYLQSIRSAGFKQLEILNRREYLKNGYEFVSLSIMGFK